MKASVLGPGGFAARAGKALRRLDPNDDPAAEPLSPFAVGTVLVLTAISVGLFLRYKLQPMQDVGHHLAMTAVVADYGREGSLYPALYKPFDWLNTNSLLYTVAGLLGKVIPAGWAFRLCMASYLAGVPLANLWALRVFGRSAWGAVIAVPLAYNISYVFGFANFLFAAPLAIVAVPLFYRMLVRPSWRRVLGVTVTVLLLFLAHVHVFLWVGVLLFLMTLVALLVTIKQRVVGRPATSPLTVLWTSALSVAPALALFGRWLYRASRGPAPDEYVTYAVEPVTWESFKAGVKAPSQLLADLPAYLELVRTEHDLLFFVWLVVAGAGIVALGRLHAHKKPPVMELAAALTFASYLVLPEHAGGQAVIGSRQIGVALWFASAFFVPVPGRVTRLGRAAAIVAVCWLAGFHLQYWSVMLRRFHKDEAAGFEEVMAAAPPRLRMHYVNIKPESRWFNLNAFWHVEKWYMLDKAGQCNENPAYGVMNSIHYRKGFEPHRVTHHEHDWPNVMEIWENFDLVLVHRWKPNDQDLTAASDRGELLARSGEWELWRSKLAR